jgi:hypothetical protein
VVVVVVIGNIHNRHGRLSGGMWIEYEVSTLSAEAKVETCLLLLTWNG